MACKISQMSSIWWLRAKTNWIKKSKRCQGCKGRLLIRRPCIGMRIRGKLRRVGVYSELEVLMKYSIGSLIAKSLFDLRAKL